jgi:hypothetical protein
LFFSPDKRNNGSKDFRKYGRSDSRYIEKVFLSYYGSLSSLYSIIAAALASPIPGIF